MEYLSLYDYLGKAAGEKLGFEVKQEANKQEILTQTREITNPKFTGTVLLYPKDFLEFYFREPESNLMDELPRADELPGNDGWLMSISDRQDYDDDLPKGHDWTGNLEDDDLPF
jgi:hypothetical protein